jgi:hypothetical protein
MCGDRVPALPRWKLCFGGMMIHSLILQGKSDMPFHSDLSVVFKAMEDRQLEYNWLITNCECNYEPKNLLLSNRISFLSGRTLTETIRNEHGSLQFIWGVLTGFSQHHRIGVDQLECTPYADGNASIWRMDYEIQYPGAALEIICWDSTFTIISSVEASLHATVKKNLPRTEDFKDYKARTAKG